MTRALMLIAAFISLLVGFASCQNEQEIKRAQYYSNGMKLYQQNCSNCHGKAGEGLGTLYPALNDEASIKSKHDELPCLVKFGSAALETVVDSANLDKEGMPGNPTLTDQEIAYILTYISNSFGNELGLIDTREVHEKLENSCR